MTPDEAAKRFARLRKMIERDLPTFIEERIAHNAVSMIHNRVVQRQQNYRGGQFSKYSTKPILTSGNFPDKVASDKVWKKLAGSESKRKKLNWVTLKAAGKNIHLFEVKGGYAEIRRIYRHNNANKSFEFSGQMWRGFGVKKKRITSNEIVITLGGKTVRSQKLIDVNSKREGINIINISDGELKKLAKMVDKQLQKYINQAGL